MNDMRKYGAPEAQMAMRLLGPYGAPKVAVRHTDTFEVLKQRGVDLIKRRDDARRKGQRGYLRFLEARLAFVRQRIGELSETDWMVPRVRIDAVSKAGWQAHDYVVGPNPFDGQPEVIAKCGLLPEPRPVADEHGRIAGCEGCGVADGEEVETLTAHRVSHPFMPAPCGAEWSDLPKLRTGKQAIVPCSACLEVELMFVNRPAPAKEGWEGYPGVLGPLNDVEYQRALEEARLTLGWDMSGDEEPWRVWNRLNATYPGGVGAFMDARLNLWK